MPSKWWSLQLCSLIPYFSVTKTPQLFSDEKILCPAPSVPSKKPKDHPSPQKQEVEWSESGKKKHKWSCRSGHLQLSNGLASYQCPLRKALFPGFFRWHWGSLEESEKKHIHHQSLTPSLPLKNGGKGRRSFPIGNGFVVGRTVKLQGCMIMEVWPTPPYRRVLKHHCPLIRPAIKANDVCLAKRNVIWAVEARPTSDIPTISCTM